MTVLRSLSVAVAAALATFAVMVSPQPAIAAAIVWGTPQNIVGDTDVSTDGTLFASANFASSTVTVNGVVFNAFPITNGGTSASSGNIAVTGSSFTVSTVSDSGGAFAALTTAYKTLLSPALTQTGPGNQLSFTLSNLTVGSTYTIQYWVNDSRNNGFGRTTNVGTQNLQVNVPDTLGGLGQYVSGTFVADASSQSFTASVGPNAPGGFGGNFTYANAMQVRVEVVPEPTTIAMLIGAGVGLPVWRLRRSKRSIGRAAAA